MSADPIQIELREHDRRITGLHGTVGRLSIDVGAHKADIAVIKSENHGTREDLAELKRDLLWLKRGVWSGVGVGLMLVLTLAGLIITLSQGG